MLFFKKKAEDKAGPPLFFTNTLSGKKELFTTLKPGLVTMYSCGPTVYSRAHIGNMRANVFSDTVARAVKSADYTLRRVTNITDVGHLVSDGDEGEDKMAVGAAREKKSPAEIADHYTKFFLEDIAALNIDTDEILFPRATNYIQEQIAMAQTLEEKGFAYRIHDGLYFDTAKFPEYGKLGGVKGVEQQEGARVKKHMEKRNPHDFALWRLAKPHDLQQWDSPWGRGNPGWHIECSAMSRALLGQTIDIHTGGIDLIPVHHNNEIAQSEAVSRRSFVRYWMHSAFIDMQGEKISKSLGNVIYVSDVIERGFHPLSLRYFFLQAHYRTPLAFSWDALAGSNEALTRLWRITQETRAAALGKSMDSEAREQITAILRDDLSTPQAIGFLWDVLRDDEWSAPERLGVIEAADAVLGLLLTEPPIAPTLSLEKLPKAIQELAKKRESARSAKDYGEADRLRDEIMDSGYRVEDGAEGPLFTKSA